MEKVSFMNTELSEHDDKLPRKVVTEVDFMRKEKGAILVARSKLMSEVENYIRRENLTQVEAAKRFKVNQPRISNITRRKVDSVSVDMLIAMLSRVGINIDVQFIARSGNGQAAQRNG